MISPNDPSDRATWLSYAIYEIKRSDLTIKQFYFSFYRFQFGQYTSSGSVKCGFVSTEFDQNQNLMVTLSIHSRQNVRREDCHMLQTFKIYYKCIAIFCMFRS